MPTDDPNFWSTLESLPADTRPTVAALVEASFSLDPKALATALTEGHASVRGTRAPTSQPPPMYLKQIRVQGFRGIGKEAVLDVPAGPGITIVTGRNGCGKSSFAEALELALTGVNSRWTNGPQDKELRRGWRNLHEGRGPRIQVLLTGEIGGARLDVSWPEGAGDVGAARFAAHMGDATHTARADVRWAESVASYRPILTYAGLGDLTQRRSVDLHDQLRNMLGLGTLAAAQSRLKALRTEREAGKKLAEAGRKEILLLVEGMEDPRAQAVAAAIRRRPWSLDTVEALSEVPPDDGVAKWMGLRGALPSASAVAGALSRMREASKAVQAQLGTSTARAHGLAALLQQALEAQQADCPVCLAPLPAQWREQTSRRLEEARSSAVEAKRAATALDEATSSAQRLVPTPPAWLFDEPSAENLVHAWRMLGELPKDGAALPRWIELHFPPVRVELERLCAEAEVRRDAQQTLWRPVALRLAAWLPVALEARSAADDLKALEQAMELLKNVEQRLTEERFLPIEAAAKANWSLLRQRSHVDLTAVQLEGTAANKQRGLSLQVSVDGIDDVALGVMSQGELHSLALSLFLPRMTHPDSPFHFLVLDDPVQAMDPHKVDGLARLLESTAKTRQVVVFTHDARLPEAILRLSVPATILEVRRSERSEVQVVVQRDAATAYLEEAHVVAYQEEVLGPAAMARVIPGFCRLALEAVFRQGFQQRMLKGGMDHAAVQGALDQATTTRKLAQLALFGGEEVKKADLYRKLTAWGGPDAVEALRMCNDGAHEGWTESRQRIRMVEGVVWALRRHL